MNAPPYEQSSSPYRTIAAGEGEERHVRRGGDALDQLALPHAVVPDEDHSMMTSLVDCMEAVWWC
jgi:hypothetical protein